MPPPSSMLSYDDIDPTTGLNILIFGPPGCGKTALAGTFPRLVVLDVDFGIKTYKSTTFLNRFGKPDLVGYYQVQDIVDPATGMFKKATGWWKAIKFLNSIHDDEGIETISIDSLSSLQALGMHVGVELAGQHKRSQTLKRATGPGGIPVILPTQADFGAEMSAFEQFMDQMLTFPQTTIFTAHEREDYTGDVITSRSPYLIGSSIRGRVGRWFDEVWYIEINRKNQRVLRTQPTNIISGPKSRALSIPDGLVDPDYDKIMEAAGG